MINNNNKLELEKILAKIRLFKKGFVVINQGIVMYAVDPANIYRANLNDKSRDDFIFTVLDISEINIRSYPLDYVNSAVMIIGDFDYYSKNMALLKRIMYQVAIIPEEDLIQTIIPHKDESKSIDISKDLDDEITELLKNTNAKKFSINNKSQIISAAVREFLLKYYTRKRFTIKIKSDESPLDYTLIGNYVFCNLCSQYECRHIRIFFRDENILTYLKKNEINISQYQIPSDIQSQDEITISQNDLDFKD